MFESGLGAKWAARVRPQPDELLSSWLVRLAVRHGMKVHPFCSAAFGGRSVWNRDIDKCADRGVLSVLVERCGVPEERAAATTLAAYEGFLYERHNPNGNTAWLMPVGVYHRKRKLFGLQFCARCLAGDADPYYRRAWRLAFVTYCEEHRAPLDDRCPECGAGVMFWRNELGDRQRVLPDSITLCHACGTDFRRAGEASRRGLPTGEADERVIRFQAELSEIARRGWASAPAHPHIYSHLYFTGLRQLLRVLATGRRARRLRERVGRECGYEGFSPSGAGARYEFERLAVGERRILLDMAHHLIDDYPRRLVALCRASRVWSSDLLRDLDDAPYWYWSVIHDHLYRPSYKTSEEEIRSVIAYIDRQGGTAYGKAISAYLGLRDVFRKRGYAPDLRVSRERFGRANIKAITRL